MIISHSLKKKIHNQNPSETRIFYKILKMIINLNYKKSNKNWEKEQLDLLFCKNNRMMIVYYSKNWIKRIKENN